MTMQIGIIGAGKMGAGVIARLLAGGHNVVVFDQNQEAVQAIW
jgi:6-phosphogluconate dehydrogenase